MILHVLPGDAYTDIFRETGLEGEVAMFREALVQGDLNGDGIEEFWTARERYHASSNDGPAMPYATHVVAEIEKLFGPIDGDEINLWFEYELFCNVNFWFCLNLLRDSRAAIYRVSPTVLDESTKWQGFGRLSADEMIACWRDRVQLTAKDTEFGGDLWRAFRERDFAGLSQLGGRNSPAFPCLSEVVEAAVEIDARPRAILREIIATGEQDFAEIFSRFGRQAGVYGFGDSQVKRLIEEIEN